jgi:hypothetical protein
LDSNRKPKLAESVCLVARASQLAVLLNRHEKEHYPLSVLAGINNVGTVPGGEAKADITRGLKALLNVCWQKAPKAVIILNPPRLVGLTQPRS